MATNNYAFVLMTMILGCATASDAQGVLAPATQPARSVTLPLVEYNRLTDLANRVPIASPPAPVAAVLSNAEMRIRVDGSIAQGTFALTGRVLRPGMNRVTLLNDATIFEANAEGRPLPMIVDGRSHQALLAGPGPFTANLEWGAPLVFKPGRASFMLPVPPAGAAHASLDIPGEQADVHLSSGSITRRTTLNGRTIVEAVLDPASPTEVSWSMREAAAVAAAREVRTVAEVMSLVTLADSDVRMVALVDLTVVQGEPRTVAIHLPTGYQLTGIEGSSVETSEAIDGRVVLSLAEPAARRHQFLVLLERPHAGGSFSFETGFVDVLDVQREQGEIAIEGVGTLDLSATERSGMHRIDVRELNAALQSLTRTPLLAGFRYQRTPSSEPGLALAVTRFPDSSVLAATADHAMATTLITAEGRALTEILLSVKNHAQPFLKVALPSGATIVSVDVAGEPAKPVTGDDGTRVPLLRPGFRPLGPYAVSFVFLHAGTPFARKGDLAMTLPQMDIPIGVVTWEIFAPENYTLRYRDGNAISQATLDKSLGRKPTSSSSFDQVGLGGRIATSIAPGEPSGRVRGTVKDQSGAVIPGATIEVTSANGSSLVATSGADGTFQIAGLPQGVATVRATLPGFRLSMARFVVGNSGEKLDIVMEIGSVAETVTVTGNTPRIDQFDRFVWRAEEPPERNNVEQKQSPSQNVINLQRRVAGLLPIRVDVPRAGTAYRFSRPLVVNDETRVSFHYKNR